jgi:hypothetical protein
MGLDLRKKQRAVNDAGILLEPNQKFEVNGERDMTEAEFRDSVEKTYLQLQKFLEE